MKLNEILNEAAAETYLVSLKDGAGFNVKATSSGEARDKAKKKLRAGQSISKVVKDRQGSNNMSDKKDQLNKFVDKDRKLQQTPSQQKSFKRKIDRATTSAKLQDTSDSISDYGSDKKKKKEEPKKEDKKTAGKK